MSYGNYGFDPAMAADADRIFTLVVDTMFNQGQIDVNMRNAIMSQYGTYRSSIINDVVTKASQANRAPDQQMIQESIHGFVTNVMQSIASRQSAGTYGGYGAGYGQPVYGGYGQPQYGVGTYGGYQTGTLYTNPRYHSNPGYGQPQYGGYQGYQGYQNNAYRGGYIPQQQQPQGTATASVTASRFTPSPDQIPMQAPVQQVVNTPAQTYTPPQDKKVEYSSPMELSNEKVENARYKGTKKIVRIGSDHMCDIFNVTLNKPVLNFKEFIKTFVPNVTSKNQYIMASVQVPKLIKAKSAEVSALMQKIATTLNASIAMTGNGFDAVSKLYSKFYSEFSKESGEAHKALSKFLVDEFNTHAACGYLFGPGVGHTLKIDTLDDIFELYDKNTSSATIREWQKNPNYETHLAAIIMRSIFSIFLGRNGYQMINTNDPDHNGIVSSIFADLSSDNVAVKDSFALLTKAIVSKNVDAATATAIPALNSAVAERTLVLVPRIYVYTNLAPAGFVTGDYAAPNINHEIATVTNVLEECIVAGFKALATTGSAPVIQGIVCTGPAMYGFVAGYNAEKHVYVTSAKDPIVTI